MKRKSLLLLIPLAIVGLAGCENANPGPNPKPDPNPCDQCETHITERSVEVEEGKTVQLHATTSVSGCPVAWASDHADVASVDGNGVVTGVSSSVNGGIAHISANGVQECTVTVKPSGQPVHEHSFSTEWSKDENGHWHECSCGAKADEADHLFGDDNICDVCGYDKGEPVPHVHTFSPEWSSNDNEHWHAATCGHDVKDGLAVHVDTDGDSKCDVCNHAMPTDPVYGTEDNPISVSQALVTMGIDCPNDKDLTKQAMYCTGTIKEIKNVYHYEDDIGSDCFELVLTDGTNDVIVYRLHSTDDLKDQVAEGNEIKICGYGKNFKGTLEFVDNGATKCILLDNGTPTPPQKEVVEVLSVKSAPESIAVGGTITPSSVILNVKLNDGTESTAAATKVECNTQAAADSVEATAWYKEVGSAKFNIKVVAQGQPVYGTEDNPISVSQALETMGIDCPNDKDLTKQAMYCTGTIKEIKNVYHYEDDIGSDCFELVLTDGTNDVIVYRLHSTDDLKDQVVEGNEIKICGYGKNFKGTLEFVDNGATKCILLDNGTPTPQKEVTGITAVSYTKTLYVGGTINPSDVTLTVSYSDETSGSVKAQSVDGYSTEEAGNTTATAHYGTFTKDFVVEVKAKPAPSGNSYNLIKSNDDVTEGQYLIVYGSKSFNGVDTTANYATVNVSDESIEASDELVYVELEEMSGGYAIKVVGGDNDEKYIYGQSGQNKLLFDTNKKLNTISVDNDGKATIVSETSVLKFNTNTGTSDDRFRYYKSTNTDEKMALPSLYKLGTPTPQKQITSVELQGTLEKSSYIEGQTFDSSGLSLKVTYNEGDPDVLTSGFTFNVTNPLAVGEYDLKATYEGHTTEGSVHISVVAKELVSIAITHGMNKTTYQVGDEWDATGIVVEGTYNDGDIQIIPSTSYELSYNPTYATDIEVTSVSIVAKMVAGDEISSEAYPQTVTVQSEPLPEPKLDSISVANASGKTNKYTEGDVISKDDLVVTAHYTEGKLDAVVTDYTISLTTALKTTDTSATITYSEGGETKTATYSFTVAEKSTTQTVEFDLIATYKEASGESNGVSFVGDKASGQNAPYHSDDCGLRVYANNTLTISASGITKVTFTINECGCEKADADFTADVGTYSEQVWTGNADTIVFTAGSRQVHVSKIVVECGPEKQITSLGTVTAPATIVKDGTLDPKNVDVAVTYDNKTTGSVHPDSIDLDTKTVGKEVIGTVHVGDLTTTFKIEVVEAPATKDYTISYNSKSDPTGLTSSPAAGNYEDSRKAQWSNNEGLTLTTDSYTNVTKVVLTTSTNANDDAYEISCTVGGVAFGETIVMKKGNNMELTFEDDAATGVIVITYTLKGTKKSIYVNSLVITAK